MMAISFSKSSLFILPPDVGAVYRNARLKSTLYANRAIVFEPINGGFNGQASSTIRQDRRAPAQSQGVLGCSIYRAGRLNRYRRVGQRSPPIRRAAAGHEWYWSGSHRSGASAADHL